MKKLLWFVLGIGAGFIAAHFMNRDPRGHVLLSELDARISEFTDRMGDAFRAEEARLAEDGLPAASDAVASDD